MWKLRCGKGKEGRPQPFRDRKGRIFMQSSSFEKAIEAQFDCLTKKVIKYERSKYYRDISRHWRNEISFSDLLEVEWMTFIT